MELSFVSLENTIGGMFYHQDAEDLVSKKENQHKFLPVNCTTVIFQVFPISLDGLHIGAVHKGWLANLNGNGKIWEVNCLTYKIFREILSPLWPVESFAI